MSSSRFIPISTISTSSPPSSLSSQSIDACCFVCNECPSSFSSFILLENHLDSQHRNRRNPLGKHNNNNNNNNNKNQSTSEKMEMKIMVKSEELEAEMEDDEGIDHRSSTLTNTPSPNGSEHSGSMLEDGRMVSHLMNKNECRFCHQIFDNQTQLSIHYTQSHSERRHYSCSECRAVFAVKRELATHFRIHQGATPHTCEECGKEFGTRQLLKKHCMWHSGERSHVCPHCNKAFFQKGHLTQHLMIHAGGRPHVCSLCNKTFIFKFDLNRHMKIHAERGFSCQHCGKAFARHKQLQEHLLVKCKANPNSAPSTPSSSQHSERRSSMISLPISIPSSTSSIAPSTPSSLLQSVPVSLSNLPQLVTPRPILPTFQNLSFGNLSVEDLHRVAQSLLTQHRPVPQPDPLPQMCLLCAQPFPSQEALFLHMSKHFTANPQLFNNALIGKQEVKPDTLRTPLSVMASLPNAMEQDEVNTPSITDSATSSSCPNSPQKTSPIEVHPSRSPSPITTTGIEERLKIKCCEECVRQRARTEELEGEVERQREMIRNTRHLLDQVSLLASQLGGCSPFDPSFALQTKHVFQQIQTALRNVECQ